MATKRIRGNTWHYTVRRAGILPKPLYLTFDDEAEGDEYVRRIEALLDRGIVPDELVANVDAPKKTLRASVRRYEEEQHITDEDHELLRIVTMRLPRELSLPELTFQWATKWVSSLKREQNLAPSTIRKHVGALSRCLTWLAAHGDIPFNPMTSLPKGYATYTPADTEAVKKIDGVAKVSTERDRRLEGDEEERIRGILAGAKPENRQRALELREGDALVLLYDMALESAMRMREMYTLSVRQIDLPRRTVFLDKTKNGDRRQVPISTVLLALLKPYLKGRVPDDQVFPWWNGDLDKKALERTTSLLSRQYSRIFESAGATGLHFHDLRHEATSRLFERTSLSDMEIAKITGHKSMSMLRRYANLRASTLAERMW
jgi:integrase